MNRLPLVAEDITAFLDATGGWCQGDQASVLAALNHVAKDVVSHRMPDIRALKKVRQVSDAATRLRALMAELPDGHPVRRDTSIDQLFDICEPYLTQLADAERMREMAGESGPGRPSDFGRYMAFVGACAAYEIFTGSKARVGESAPTARFIKAFFARIDVRSHGGIHDFLKKYLSGKQSYPDAVGSMREDITCVVQGARSAAG